MIITLCFNERHNNVCCYRLITYQTALHLTLDLIDGDQSSKRTGHVIQVGHEAVRLMAPGGATTVVCLETHNRCLSTTPVHHHAHVGTTLVMDGSRGGRRENDGGLSLGNLGNLTLHSAGS